MIGTIILVLLFALFASPFMFKTVASYAGAWVANNAGSPTPAGLFLHGAIFVVLVGVVMSRKSKYADQNPFDISKYADQNPFDISKYADQDPFDISNPAAAMT
jgi:hypothetical protein